MSEVRDVIIIGSGPAGLTAAIYTARADMRPLMVEGYQAGGQLRTTTDVENYPGFDDGVMGPDLMDKFRHQAERFGTEFITADVERVDFSQRPFKVFVEGDEEPLLARSVIVATGATAKRIGGVAGEDEYSGRGVSYCATCDGFFFRDKTLVVVGGGDTAMEEATFLTKFASKVTVVHRRDTLRASKPMQRRAFDNPKIEFVWDSAVEEVLGDERAMTGVRVRNLKTGETSEIAAGGLFVAIGHEPNTGLFRGVLDMDENGYLLVGHGTGTNIPGVFAVGDVADHVYRQAVTAAGSGCMGAIDAERFLASAGDDTDSDILTPTGSATAAWGPVASKGE
jgi:thioredoxin reductase (NADPH)